MVSNSAKLDRRTKQHTEFGVSAFNGSRDIARTKVAEKKEKKMNVDNPIKHPLRGSLIKSVHCAMYKIVNLKVSRSLYAVNCVKEAICKQCLE